MWTTTELYYRYAAKCETMLVCETCCKATSHCQQLRALTQPNVLLMQPGRRDGVSDAGRVVRHRVQPEKDLSLPGHDRYELYAVVYHRGRRATSGHYYCVVKAHDGRWWRFDDESVRVFRGDVEHSEMAYVHLMVYTRPRGQARFSGMGPLLAPGADDRSGANTAWVLKELEQWPVETWRRRVQAFVNGRKTDVDATTDVTVTHGDAEKLRDSVLDENTKGTLDVLTNVLRAVVHEDEASAAIRERQLGADFSSYLKFAAAQAAGSSGVSAPDAAGARSLTGAASCSAGVGGASSAGADAGAGAGLAAAAAVVAAVADAAVADAASVAAAVGAQPEFDGNDVVVGSAPGVPDSAGLGYDDDEDSDEWIAALWSEMKRSAPSAGRQSLLKRRRGTASDVLEAEQREIARARLMSFGCLRSPSGVEGLLQPKDVGAGGWCFFNAFCDQLGSREIPNAKYLAVLALAAMAERHVDFAPSVQGVGWDLCEAPEIRDARAALACVGPYRGMANVLTPFECVVLDKFEGVLSGDLLESRRYADAHEMHVLLQPCGLKLLVLEGREEAGEQLSRVYPGAERLDDEDLRAGALDMVFVRYQSGAFEHYESVCFADGGPWRVRGEVRERVEAWHAACAVSQALRRGEVDVARASMLSLLQTSGASGAGAVL